MGISKMVVTPPAAAARVRLRSRRVRDRQAPGSEMDVNRPAAPACSKRRSSPAPQPVFPAPTALRFSAADGDISVSIPVSVTIAVRDDRIECVRHPVRNSVGSKTRQDIACCPEFIRSTYSSWRGRLRSCPGEDNHFAACRPVKMLGITAR
jgi:hypothetical protein